MKYRYFIIEPAFSDPDTFCRLTVGGEHVRASIQIYPDEAMLHNVAVALTDPNLPAEYPELEEQDWQFYIHISVLPEPGMAKTLRVRIWHDYEEDGTPFRADIKLHLTPAQAAEFAKDLLAWLETQASVLCWKD